jgi:hypothetical protein
MAIFQAEQYQRLLPTKDRRFVIGAFAAFTLLICSAFASGDQYPEESDEPPPTAVGTPRSLLHKNKPAAASPEEDTEELPPLPGTARHGKGRVLQADLDAPDARIYGTLSVEEGGLGLDLWKQTPALLVAEGLADLPPSLPSKSRQDLFTALLLSAAYDPHGPMTPPMLTLRAEQLYRLGFVDEAWALLLHSENKIQDLRTLRLETRLHLTKQDLRLACTNAARTRNEIDDPFWLRLRTFCYILAKDRPSAQLNIDLLAEQGLDDPLFFSSVAALLDGADLPLTGLTIKDEIHRALLDLLDVSLPKAVILNAPYAQRYPVLSRVEQAEVTDTFLSYDLAIAEEACIRGVVKPEVILALYGKVPFQESERQKILEGTDLNDPRRRAALAQSLNLAIMPLERAGLLKQAYDEAIAVGMRSLFVRTHGQLIKTIPIEPRFESYALDFAWIALSFGAEHEAAGWLDLAAERGRQDQKEKREVARTTALTTAFQIVTQDRRSLLPSWPATKRLTEARNTKFARQALLEIRLHQAFGGILDGETRAVLLDYPLEFERPMPETGVLSGLDAAARAGRKGEVIVYTLQALGDSKSAHIPVTVLEKTVAGLVRSKFSNNAKTLALESLLAGL